MPEPLSSTGNRDTHPTKDSAGDSGRSPPAGAQGGGCVSRPTEDASGGRGSSKIDGDIGRQRGRGERQRHRARVGENESEQTAQRASHCCGSGSATRPACDGLTSSLGSQLRRQLPWERSLLSLSLLQGPWGPCGDAVGLSQFYKNSPPPHTHQYSIVLARLPQGRRPRHYLPPRHPGAAARPAG